MFFTSPLIDQFFDILQSLIFIPTGLVCQTFHELEGVPPNSYQQCLRSALIGVLADG
jgi:hypothetical protein